MYEAHYGLTSKPFQLNPDPSFYFGSKQHTRASAYLDYGLHQNQGFIVITGEVGAGKTTIVRNLLEKLDSSKVLAAQLVSTQLDADDTLRMVGAAFGVRIRDVPKSELLVTLEAYFTMAATENKRCLLIVDEAQNLSQRAVEELRMLSNFQYGNISLLQTFLVGQPEFRAILQSPEMTQLRQRVIATCHISPMDRPETEHYIEHRMKCAGYIGAPLFDSACYDAIFDATTGIPRRINTLCDRILLSGFLEDKKRFSAEDIGTVVEESAEENKTPTPTQRTPLSAESISTVAMAASGETEFPVLGDVTLEGGVGILDKLNAADQDERIRRLERSMLRIEKSNSTVIALLQQVLLELRDGSAIKSNRAP